MPTDLEDETEPREAIGPGDVDRHEILEFSLCNDCGATLKAPEQLTCNICHARMACEVLRYVHRDQVASEMALQLLHTFVESKWAEIVRGKR
jgi:hypothetical protein